MHTVSIQFKTINHGKLMYGVQLVMTRTSIDGEGKEDLLEWREMCRWQDSRDTFHQPPHFWKKYHDVVHGVVLGEKITWEEALVAIPSWLFPQNLLTHFKISLKPPHALQQFWAFMPIDFFLLTGSLFEHLCQYDADAADADVADPAESDIWPIYDWYMTDIWPIYDWYMADIWLIYDFNFLVVLCRDTAAS